MLGLDEVKAIHVGAARVPPAPPKAAPTPPPTPPPAPAKPATNPDDTDGFGDRK